MLEKSLTFLEKRLKIDVGYTLRGGSWLISGHAVGVLAALLTSYIFANFLSPDRAPATRTHAHSATARR